MVVICDIVNLLNVYDYRNAAWFGFIYISEENLQRFYEYLKQSMQIVTNEVGTIQDVDICKE